MTLAMILDMFSILRKTNCVQELLIIWISELDKKISSELLEVRGAEKFNGYEVDCDLDIVLKAPYEFFSIYVFYLDMKVNYMNSEIERYNNSAMLFNRAYKELSDYISRNTQVTKKTRIKAGELYV